MAVEETLPGHGVQALIERLRAEGVEAGRQEAEEILAKARAQAERILADAQAEAERLVAQARQTQAQLESATRQALALAMRDAKLRLREELSAAFDHALAGLLRQIMNPVPFLEQLVLHVAGAVGQSLPAGPATLLLPPQPTTLEELRRTPEPVHPGTLTHVALGVLQEMLRQGIEIKPGRGFEAGLHVMLEEQGIVVDLSDAAVSEFLSAHLRPRFRLLLEGVLGSDAP